MRVTLCAPHFPPRYLAGVEMVTSRLAGWLSARGHSPDVVCIEGFEAVHADRIAAVRDSIFGYPVHRLTVPAGDFTRSYHDSRLEDWLAGHLAREQPDVLHLHSGYLFGASALRAARRSGTPCVVSLHDYWFLCHRLTLLHPSGRPCSGPDHGVTCAWCLNGDRRALRAIDRPLGGALSRLVAGALRAQAVRRLAGMTVAPADMARRHRLLTEALETARCVTAPSRFVADIVADGFGRRVPVHVVRLGLGARGADDRAPRSRRAAGEPLRVGYLGQIARHKGIDVLVSAVRSLPRAAMTLTVHGALEREPSYVAELRRASDRDPRIRLAGAYPNADVGRVLGAMDLLVVPSVWNENSPAVVLEAQAHGVPVVASRIGGLPEMVRDGVDGVLFTAGDVSALAAVLGRCAAEPAFLQGLADGVRPPRTADEEGAEWLALYERACAAAGEPAAT